MSPIKFFHTDKNFPSISPLEKIDCCQDLRNVLVTPPRPLQVQKNVFMANSICESSRITVSVEDLKFGNTIGKSLYETLEIPAQDQQLQTSPRADTKFHFRHPGADTILLTVLERTNEKSVTYHG